MANFKLSQATILSSKNIKHFLCFGVNFAQSHWKMSEYFNVDNMLFSVIVCFHSLNNQKHSITAQQFKLNHSQRCCHYKTLFFRYCHVNLKLSQTKMEKQYVFTPVIFPHTAHKTDPEGFQKASHDDRVTTFLKTSLLAFSKSSVFSDSEPLTPWSELTYKESTEIVAHLKMGLKWNSMYRERIMMG